VFVPYDSGLGRLASRPAKQVRAPNGSESLSISFCGAVYAQFAVCDPGYQNSPPSPRPSDAITGNIPFLNTVNSWREDFWASFSTSFVAAT